MYKHIKTLAELNECQPAQGMALFELMDLFSGKWKVIIIGMLLHQELRFTELQKLISGITPRMLSKDLKDLELNGMVYRTVINTTPVLIKYGCTDSAKRLEEPFSHLINWAIQHRNEVLKSLKV